MVNGNKMSALQIVALIKSGEKIKVTYKKAVSFMLEAQDKKLRCNILMDGDDDYCIMSRASQ